jgi:hypothetical protein
MSLPDVNCLPSSPELQQARCSILGAVPRVLARLLHESPVGWHWPLLSFSFTISSDGRSVELNHSPGDDGLEGLGGGVLQWRKTPEDDQRSG